LSITPGTASQGQISCIRSLSIRPHKDWKKHSGNRRDTGTLEKKKRKKDLFFSFRLFVCFFNFIPSSRSLPLGISSGGEM